MTRSDVEGLMRTTVTLSTVLLALVAALSAQVVPVPPTILRQTHGLDDWQPDGTGKWRMDGNTLVLFEAGVPGGPIRRPAGITIFKSAPVADFTMAVDVRSTAPVDLEVRDVLLIFDWQSPTQFYYVHMAAKTDAVHTGIFLVNNADRLRIDDGKGVPKLKDQAWHRTRLERDAVTGKIAVYFDDALLLTATDKTLPSGRVGVGSFDETGEFRNFEVRAVKKSAH